MLLKAGFAVAWSLEYFLMRQWFTTSLTVGETWAFNNKLGMDPTTTTKKMQNQQVSKSSLQADIIDSELAIGE